MMKWYKVIIPTAVGVAAGALFAKKVKEKSIPEKALDRAKNMFANGKITGSWIVMEKELLSENNEELYVYRGGLTHLIDGIEYEYEFFADEENGEIIELKLA